MKYSIDFKSLKDLKARAIKTTKQGKTFFFVRSEINRGESKLVKELESKWKIR